MYQEVEENLHKSAQFISLTGINKIPAASDDSHTNATWNRKKLELQGKPFELDGSQYYIAIQVKEFNLLLCEAGGQTESALHLQGRSVGNVKTSLQNMLDIDKDQWKGLHYDLKDGYFHDQTVLELPDDQSIYDWILYRNLAGDSLENLNKKLIPDSTIAVWPHHFDTGANFSYQQGKKVIGAGLAMADEMVNEPYFYIYGWSADDDVNYENLPELDSGSWILENWKGAVLPVSKLNQEEQAINIVNNFFEKTAPFFEKQFS